MAKRIARVPVGRIVTGDCVRTMDRWPAGSVDAIVTSPPYPRIKRAYGTWTEPQWLLWMKKVVAAGHRLLKPNGSMVFVIGPNYRRVGELAPWPYRFVLDIMDAGHNVVQDAYWVKTCRIPVYQTRYGLMRDVVEWCVWVGPPDCYRNAKDILWEYADATKKLIKMGERGKFIDAKPNVGPSGIKANNRTLYRDRGGATPMNAMPTATVGSEAMGHPAAFPELLATFWLKYICPPKGIVLDPFAGSGTTCTAAAKHGRRWVGIERVATYARRARLRVRRAARNATTDH